MNAITPAEAQQPHNIEAEQQVLGALLAAGEDADRRVAYVAACGGAEVFFEPAHAAIFTEIARRVGAGLVADAVGMKAWAAEADALKGLGGGAAYLVRLQLAAVASAAFKDYAKHLADQRARRMVLETLEAGRLAALDEREDVPTITGRLETALGAIAAPSRRQSVSIMRATHKAMEDFLAARAGDRRGVVGTGLHTLDGLFGGFRPGEMVLLGGRPSMGKTSVALSLALNAARAGHGVLFASLEMNPDQMAVRAISEGTSQLGRAVTYRDILSGAVRDADMDVVTESARRLAELPIEFLAREYNDIGAFVGEVKAQKRRKGASLGLVVIDYLQLLKGQGRGRYEDITNISIEVKGLAGATGLPILALSQLSRQVESREDKRPNLSDLRESGQLEQDADAVMFCYRDEYYLEREEPTDPDQHDDWAQAMKAARHRVDVIVAKQRQGAVGTARLRCNVATNMLWEDRF